MHVTLHFIVKQPSPATTAARRLAAGQDSDSFSHADTHMHTYARAPLKLPLPPPPLLLQLCTPEAPSTQTTKISQHPSLTLKHQTKAAETRQKKRDSARKRKEEKREAQRSGDDVIKKTLCRFKVPPRPLNFGLFRLLLTFLCIVYVILHTHTYVGR